MNKQIYDLLKDKKRLKDENLFIVDTEKILDEVLKENLEIKYFLYTEKEKNILNKFKKTNSEFIKVKESYIDKFSVVDSHQGFLAVVKAPADNEIKNFDVIKKFVLLDTIQEPSNLGAIIRSGVAFGFENFLLLNCAYIYNEKTIRASAGTVFLCKYKNIEQNEIAELYGKYQIIITSSNVGMDFDIIKNKISNKYIIVLGNEGKGIRSDIKTKADLSIKIMHDKKVESLNVAATAAIIFYEFKRLKEN